MKTRHMMIDLEALRLTQLHKAPLMNIGAVIFDEQANVIKELDVYIHPDKQPLIVEPESSTLKFWSEQKMWPILKDRMYRMGVSPHQALSLLTTFFEANHCSTFWFNGPMYDRLILRAYFEREGMVEPWEYSGVRDLRTVRKQYKDLLDEHLPRKEVMHLGVQDCIDQIAILRCITEQTGHIWA